MCIIPYGTFNSGQSSQYQYLCMVNTLYYFVLIYFIVIYSKFKLYVLLFSSFVD